MNAPSIAKFNTAMQPLTLPERIAYIAKQFPSLGFTTAFGTEDQLITWAIIDAETDMTITTHLKGPLLEQNRPLHEITQERYDIVIPTNAKNGGSIWISGRAQHAQNANRSASIAVWHEDKQMLEINPLADWSFEEVLQAIAEHEVPINPLYNSGTNHAALAEKKSPAAENRTV